MNKRIPALILAVLMLITVLTACSRNRRQPGDPAKAVFISQITTDPSQKFAWDEFERLKNEFSFEMTAYPVTNGTADEITAIEYAVAEKYDVIFINPSNPEGVVTALKRAYDSGITVGVFATNLPEANQNVMHFFNGSDDYEGSRYAAYYLATVFPEGARFVEIGGPTGTYAQARRHEGFLAGLPANIYELDSENVTDGWNTAEARTIMENFLMAYGDDIDIVWCHWDDGAAAAISATQAAGRTDLFIIGFDGTGTGFDNVRDGKQSLSIGQDISLMVRQSLETARAKLDGEDFEKINIIQNVLILSENVNSMTRPDW